MDGCKQTRTSLEEKGETKNGIKESSDTMMGEAAGVDSHLLNSIPLLLAVPEQHKYSQSGPEVSGSYFLERDYRPLLLGGTRPPGLNSSATRPTRCRKQVNRHSSDICRWVTVQ